MSSDSETFVICEVCSWNQYRCFFSSFFDDFSDVSHPKLLLNVLKSLKKRFKLQAAELRSHLMRRGIASASVPQHSSSH